MAGHRPALHAYMKLACQHPCLHACSSQNRGCSHIPTHVSHMMHVIITPNLMQSCCLHAVQECLCAPAASASVRQASFEERSDHFYGSQSRLAAALPVPFQCRSSGHWNYTGITLEQAPLERDWSETGARLEHWNRTGVWNRTGTALERRWNSFVVVVQCRSCT